jgi:hypothetical protein
MEGAASYGAGITCALQQAGIAVAEVERPTRPARRLAGKSDRLAWTGWWLRCCAAAASTNDPIVADTPIVANQDMDCSLLPANPGQQWKQT